MKDIKDFCDWIGEGEYLGYSFKIGYLGRGKPIYFWKIEDKQLIGGGYFELCRCHLSALSKIRCFQRTNS